MSDLYLRKVGLVVVGAKGNGLDLSQFRITFRISAADVESPNTAIIKIYNLSDSEAQQIKKEFLNISLQAGYQNGNYGVIFQGNIKQVKIGRESAIDSYVEIYAGDGDKAYNFSTTSMTLAAGSTPQQRAAALQKSMAANGIVNTNTSGLSATGGVLPRGKVLFGLARDQARDLAASSNCSWSIQNGVLTFSSLTGYSPGVAVVLNAQTGLIGIPEATDNGIRIRSLLNPLFAVGGRVQVNNALINQTTIQSQGYPNYKSVNFTADTTADGIYRILVAEHSGDSRGHDWYTDLTCLSLDGSAPVNHSVMAYG